MKIACLGWGSLVWKQGPLDVKGEWKLDGPVVPIEFCRVSDGGELATAICLNTSPVQVLWSWLNTDNLASAIEMLRLREGIPADRIDGIGSMTLSEQPVGTLAEWAQEKGIESVIWTGLPARSLSTEGRVPSAEEVISYLSQLEGETRHHARRYIEQVPAQIDTPYRREIARQLNWRG